MESIKEPLVQTEEFTILGLQVQTSNQKGDAEVQIPQIYSRFYKDDLPKKLESIRKYDPLYAVYFQYESDETGKYYFMLGYAVDKNVQSFGELKKLTIPSQKGRYFAIQPGAPEEVVPKFWKEIWEHPEIPKIRTFQFDWEEYSEAGIRVFLSSK